MGRAGAWISFCPNVMRPGYTRISVYSSPMARETEMVNAATRAPSIPSCKCKHQASLHPVRTTLPSDNSFDFHTFVIIPSVVCSVLLCVVKLCAESISVSTFCSVVFSCLFEMLCNISIYCIECFVSRVYFCFVNVTATATSGNVQQCQKSTKTLIIY